MKHKQDAIDKANVIIQSHIEDGLSKEQAERAAVITVNYVLKIGVYPAEESIHQRAKNYLYSIIFGEEIAKELHELEAKLHNEYCKMRNYDYQHYDNQKLRSIELENKIKEIKKTGLIV